MEILGKVKRKLITAQLELAKNFRAEALDAIWEAIDLIDQYKTAKARKSRKKGETR